MNIIINEDISIKLNGFVYLKDNPNYLMNKKGDIFSLKMNNLMKKKVDSNGYEYVGIYFNNNKNKNKMIHRLVAQTFLPNLLNKPEINHKDGDKLNNKLENLEWCTRSENIKHAIKIGLIIYNKKKLKGIKDYAYKKRKLSENNILDIKELRKNKTLKEIADIYNVSINLVHKILNKGYCCGN